jgi:hypothetical protein
MEQEENQRKKYEEDWKKKSASFLIWDSRNIEEEDAWFWSTLTCWLQVSQTIPILYVQQ